MQIAKQNNVEYAFRDTAKPMGVVTFKAASELSKEFKNILPDAEQLGQFYEKEKNQN